MGPCSLLDQFWPMPLIFWRRCLLSLSLEPPPPSSSPSRSPPPSVSDLAAALPGPRSFLHRLPSPSSCHHSLLPFPPEAGRRRIRAQPPAVRGGVRGARPWPSVSIRGLRALIRGLIWRVKLEGQQIGIRPGAVQTCARARQSLGLAKARVALGLGGAGHGGRAAVRAGHRGRDAVRNRQLCPLQVRRQRRGGAQVRRPDMARRSTSSVRGGVDERELQPVGGGGGKGGWGAGDETKSVRARARGVNCCTGGVGAPHSTRRRRGRRGWFGCPAKLGALVGGLLECVFFFQPLLFELGLK
jgi:hypothetical protein